MVKFLWPLQKSCKGADLVHYSTLEQNPHCSSWIQGSTFRPNLLPGPWKKLSLSEISMYLSYCKIKTLRHNTIHTLKWLVNQDKPTVPRHFPISGQISSLASRLPTGTSASVTGEASPQPLGFGFSTSLEVPQKFLSAIPHYHQTR